MRCRACDSGRLALEFEMGPMPLAGGFALTAEDAKAMPRHPLEWWRCERCGLVNVFPDIPDADIYSDYSYRASDVPALVRHHGEFAAWLAERFGPGIRHLEIGGNDGVLMRQLPKRWERVNCDPSDVAWVPPDERDWQVSIRRFGTDAVKNERWTGRFDLVTSSNAFAHFTNIGDALDGVREALNDEGRFVVEVHDLDATLASGQWDTIYHEHKVEWSHRSLVLAGLRHGLELVGFERIPLHGGMLRATFKAGSVLFAVPRVPGFSALRERYANRKPTGARHAYGAAARATVYLNQVPEDMEAIFDDSPRRIGRFVPGTGTPILSGAEMPDDGTTLITAWPQADDIKARHPGYRGQWVTAW